MFRTCSKCRFGHVLWSSLYFQNKLLKGRKSDNKTDPGPKSSAFWGTNWCSYFLLMRIFFLLSCWNHSVYKRWLIVHPLVCGLLLWGLRLMIWVALVNWTHMTRAKGWADRETENTVCSHIGEILWNHCLFYNNRRLNIQNKHCWRKLETSNWHHELNWEELKEEEEVFFRINFIWKWQTAL